jgi:hypothetical protein
MTVQPAADHREWWPLVRVESVSPETRSMTWIATPWWDPDAPTG